MLKYRNGSESLNDAQIVMFSTVLPVMLFVAEEDNTTGSF